MRAVDNQVYFIAASPARNKGSDYQAYGFSTICDPWGTVIANADEKESIITAEIDEKIVKGNQTTVAIIKG